MTWRVAVHAFKKELLTSALIRHHGNRAATARELGLSREYVWKLFKDLGVTIPASCLHTTAPLTGAKGAECSNTKATTPRITESTLSRPSCQDT